ncbi:MAG TPA: hypothetical protein VK028_05770 [Micromonosporaceae bacterium]|nr:hypothetical protein [Micromonosporaceae bacterium]
MALAWKPDPSTPLKGAITVTGVTTRYQLYWGDGQSVSGQPNKTYTHTYYDPDIYTAYLIREGEVPQKPFLTATYRVLPSLDQLVTVAQVPGELSVGVTIDEEPNPTLVPRYRITWTRDAITEVLGEPGRTYSHWYGTAGKHQVNVLDRLSGVNRAYQVPLVEPVVDPDFTLAEDTADPQRYTVTLTVAHAEGQDRTFTVDWGDASAAEQLPAAAGQTLTHEYALPSTYDVYLRYSDDPDTYAIRSVTVPFEAAE